MQKKHTDFVTVADTGLAGIRQETQIHHVKINGVEFETKTDGGIVVSFEAPTIDNTGVIDAIKTVMQGSALTDYVVDQALDVVYHAKMAEFLSERCQPA